MTSRFHHVAPAGAPIRPRELRRWLRTVLSSNDLVAGLEGAVSARLGVRRAFPVSTGRAGLSIILRAMRRLRPQSRDEVIVPSYTCYSVPASVIRAGLKPRIVDVRPDTLDYDRLCLERIDARRALAIVATNLYGLPCDMPRLSAFAHAAGLFLIDDAAQALGAKSAGRFAGTWGDAGLYSFDKGKNLSAIEGGLIVTADDELADVLSVEVAALPSLSGAHTARWLVGLLAYAALLAPSRYWIPNSLRGLGLGTTSFSTVFPIAAAPRLRTALMLTMIERLDDFTASRRANAAILRSALQDFPGLMLVQPAEGSEPAYLRFPVLVSDPNVRRTLLVALRRAGIGATTSYPGSIADIPQLAEMYRANGPEMAGGRFVAEHIMTLPTQPYVSERDLAVIVDIIRRALTAPVGSRFQEAVAEHV